MGLRSTIRGGISGLCLCSPPTPVVSLPVPLRADPKKASTRIGYWRYSCNELGTQDMAAQMERIHNVKCTELGAGQVGELTGNLDRVASAAMSPGVLACVSEAPEFVSRCVYLCALWCWGTGYKAE